MIGLEDIGVQIVDHVGDGSAVLIRSHGVFTIGASPQTALRAAEYTEECAEVAHFALLRGDLEPLPDETVAASRAWYLTGYAQSAIGSGA